MCEPIDWSIIVKNRRTSHDALMKFQENLIRFSAKVADILLKIAENESPTNETIDWVSKFYEMWLKCFISDYNMHKKSTAIGIFATLCQAKFIMQYNRIKFERDQIVSLNKFPDEQENFLVRRFLDNNEEKPIMMFSQSDVMDGLLHLSGKLNILKYDEIPAFIDQTDALFTRCGTMFCEFNTDEIFNVECMRRTEDDLFSVNIDFCKYCTVYFNTIFRRIFWFNLTKKLHNVDLPEEIEQGAIKLQEMFEKEVCKFIGPDSIEDLYVSVCQYTYNFPGDAEWFSYHYPSIDGSTETLLETMRPAHAKIYFTEHLISQKPIILGITLDNQQHGYNCRTFLLTALDRYISSHVGCVNWKNCVVMPNEIISTSEGRTKITQKLIPILIQIMSRYWVLDGNVIWVTDCIYKALTCWCYALRKNYNSELLNRNFKNFIEKIL
jgi:hypothetical protein